MKLLVCGHARNSDHMEHAFLIHVYSDSEDVPADILDSPRFQILDAENGPWLRIPEGITSICTGAFSGNSEWRIVLPYSLCCIGYGALRPLAAIRVPVGHCRYRMENGCLLGKVTDDTDELLWAPRETVINRIPNTVDRFAADVFSGNTSLESIHLPENLKIIPENAFEACTSLHRIFLPKKLNRVESGAFSGCIRLSAVVMEGQTYFHHFQSALFSEQDAFPGLHGILFFCDRNPWMDPYFKDHNFIGLPLEKAAPLLRYEADPSPERERKIRNYLTARRLSASEPFRIKRSSSNFHQTCKLHRIHRGEPDRYRIPR